MDLHSLFDDFAIVSMRILVTRLVPPEYNIPSNGFMRASLAMVAQAPLVARWNISIHEPLRR